VLAERHPDQEQLGLTSATVLRPALMCASAVLIAAVVYLNALTNPFVYDDYRTVVGNQSIEQLANLRAIAAHDPTRPLVNLSYAFDYALWNRRVAGYHLTNIALHALNTGLLFVLAWCISAPERRNAAAFTAAALLAVHPVLTEAVGYVSGRSEVLCTSLLLMALLAGRRWLRTNRVGYGIATVVLWLGSMAARETGIVFPFVFAAYEWLAPDVAVAGRSRRLTTIHLPLIAIAVFAAVARAAVLSRIEHPGQLALSWPMVLVTLNVLRRYTLLMVVPVGQAVFHSVPESRHVWEPAIVGSLVVLALMIVTVWQCRRRAWMVSFGLIWFLLALAPSSVLVMLGRAEPMAEHRVYLAGCGLFLAAGAVAQQLWVAAERRHPQARWLMTAALTSVLAAFAVDTMSRNVRWRDPVGLWTEAVQGSPDHFWPRLLLGEALMQSDRPAEALEQFETAVRLVPSLSEPYAKVGICLISLGRPTEARAYLQEALARDPNSESARQAMQFLDTPEPAGPGQPTR
jgi:hypothetical protein